jgi:hypothetical protein
VVSVFLVWARIESHTIGLWVDDSSHANFVGQQRRFFGIVPDWMVRSFSSLKADIFKLPSAPAVSETKAAEPAKLHPCWSFSSILRV